MKKIKLLHVGLGGWGGNWAEHVLAHHPDIETIGYVDPVPAARERMQIKLGVAPKAFFPTLEEALAKTEAEAVVIAVPIAFHAPVARTALNAGKHVVVEKPFTRTLEEAQELVNLAKTKNLVLAVSQNYRFYPASQMAADINRHQHLGALRSVKVDFRRNAALEGSGNIKWPDPMLADMAVHHYDLMRMVIGADPIEISARSWNPPGSPYEMDPAATMSVSFPGGIVVSYRGSWVDQGSQTAWAGEWQMDFELGSVRWTSRGDHPWQTSRDRVQVKHTNSGYEDIPLPPLEMVDRAGVLSAFAETIRTGVEPPYFPAGRVNVPTLAMVEAALKSAAGNGISTPVTARA